jgi:ubiquinone/menaquinone biosynthesis C-methylase UbiE
MDQFFEAEIQVLIATLELVEPKETPNNNFYKFHPRTLEEAASYFRKYRTDWTAAYDSLIAKGLLVRSASLYRLTEGGIGQARRMRDARPPIYYWYEEFYSEAPESPAFRKFCERLYGKALCQDGFADMAQLETLLRIAKIGEGQRVLDLGCGPGMIAEYISDSTGACVTGLDYSPQAIALARARTGGKKHRMSFGIGNLDDLPFAPCSFDVVISIDSLYMPNDLDGTLTQMLRILSPGGRIAAFYSQMARDSRESREILREERTPLGAALRKAGLAYRAYDFSAENFRFLCRKRQVVEALKDDFAQEGRLFLYDYIFVQSESDQGAAFDPETTGMSRYLYFVET